MRNSWTKSRQKSEEFSFLLFTINSTALPCDFYHFNLSQPLMYFFKLTQPLTYYNSVTVHCKGEGGKPERKPYHLQKPQVWEETSGLRRNLRSEKKPQVWELSRLCPGTSTSASRLYCSSLHLVCRWQKLFWIFSLGEKNTSMNEKILIRRKDTRNEKNTIRRKKH